MTTYGHVHAKNVGDLVELRFKFEELVEKKQKEDQKAGKPVTNTLSAVQVRLE